MESKYNIENFERFLREKTDEFKMYPSKRVWYSIYNNMHPGNKLPSVSMCIILICSLLLVGYLNTDTQKARMAADSYAENSNSRLFLSPINPGKEIASIYLAENQAADRSQDGTSQPIDNSNASGAGFSKTKYAAATVVSQKNLAGIQQQNNDRSNRPTAGNLQFSTAGKKSGTITIHQEASTSTVPQDNHSDQYAPATIESKTIANPDQITVISNSPQLVAAPQQNLVTTEHQQLAAETVSASNGGVSDANTLAMEMNETSGKSKDLATNDKMDEQGNGKVNTDEKKAMTLSGSDKAWMENFAMYNRPAPKKWAGKLSWQAYITPSVVYRKLYNNTTDKSLSGNGNGNFNNSDIDNTVIQKPSVGLETGLSLQYDVLKWVRVKAGVQLNYTRYNSHAFENHHPISTSLIMNGADDISAYEVFRTTPYSNTVGLNPIKLHNETYQVSLPVGADLRLLSSGNLAWYAGATIQPTFVIYANTFLLSSDRRNYVKDASMLNRFNLNAGFETYISFKTNNYTWQVGPQFRSQLFSTNNKVYSVEERLVNYGLKIGVTKKL